VTTTREYPAIILGLLGLLGLLALLGLLGIAGLPAGCSTEPATPYVCDLPLVGVQPEALQDPGVDGGAGGAECQPRAHAGNLFADVLGKSPVEIGDKVEAAFQSMFHGGDNATVYYEVGADEAYILDVYDNDVRTEGMSYGMMVAVQLDKKDAFDRLWTWAKHFMYQSSGPTAGYFTWHRTREGGPVSSHADGPAPDGEEYFATALILASQRWGNGAGIYDYGAEARALLDVMIHKGEDAEAQAAGVTSMIDPTHKLIVFVPSVWAQFTDPSYVVPAFYDLWACFDTKNADFWREVSASSRAFFPKVTDPTTGLAPEYASFDGAPSTFPGKGDFGFDAWRVVMNVMADLHYRGVDPWQPTYAVSLGTFFASQGNYGNQYTLAGQKLGSEHTAGLVAMNATLGLGLAASCSRCFVQPLWDMPAPTGRYRYYNGLLYLLSLLHASGNFRLAF
jgi:oligosaccharide reducing-end xylanase